MSKPCILCHKHPCLCAARTAASVIFDAVRADPKAALEIGFKPSVDDAVAAFTNPISPYCLGIDEVISLCNKLRAATMMTAVRNGSTIEDVVHGLFVDLSQAASRVVEAIKLIVETNAVLDEGHPKIADHRAWLIDQLLDILADRHYDCIVDLARRHFVGESPFPEDKSDNSQETPEDTAS